VPLFCQEFRHFCPDKLFIKFLTGTAGVFILISSTGKATYVIQKKEVTEATEQSPQIAWKMEMKVRNSERIIQ